MDANELLKTWPGWASANAERVFESPAWRLETHFADEPARLTRLAALEGPLVTLEVAVDGTDQVLAFAPSPVFPDLWLLRDRLSGLPSEVLLALVEKECGPFFQFIEDFLKKSFAVRGVSTVPSEGQTAFVLATSAGEISFSIGLTSELVQRLGVLANLDSSHESVRSLTREARIRHATLELSDEELAALGVGDFLLLESGLSSEWTIDVPDDATVQVLSPEAGQLTFAQLADGDLPPVPETAAYSLVRRGTAFATAELSKVGLAPALKILTI